MEMVIIDFTSKVNIINEYMDAVQTRLPFITTEELGRLRELSMTRFIDKEILFNNSYTCEEKEITSSNFLTDIFDNEIIMNENGVFFKAPTCREEIPPTVECEIYLGNDRDHKKGLMKYFLDPTKGNDPIKADYNNRAQNNDKECMNTYYGALQVPGGPFYNIDLAETITCRGRNMVAVSALTVEGIFDGLVPSSLEGILYYIDKHSKFDGSSYRILTNPNNKNHSVEEIVGRFADKVPLDYLRHVESVLNTKTQTELNAIGIKNNFESWIGLDEVYSAIKDFYIYLKESGKAFLNPYDRKDPNVLNHLNMIRSLVYILHGFTWYQETISRYGELLNNPQDTIRDIDRYFVALIDTDSNMIAMLMYSLFDEFLDHMSKSDKEFTITNTLAVISDEAITISMANYTEALHVPKDLRDRVAMKNEYYYSDFGLTPRKKNYAGLMCLKEGVAFAKPKLDVKGMMFIKSVVNANTAAKISNVVENMILRSDSLDLTKILRELDDCAIELEEMLKSKEGSSYYTPQKLNTSLLKVLPAQARTKTVEFYNILDIGDRIVTPSKFYTIKVDINQASDVSRIERFSIFKKIYEIHTNLRSYTDFDIVKFSNNNASKLRGNITEIAETISKTLSTLLDEILLDRPDMDIFVSSYLGSNRESKTPMSRDEIFYSMLSKYNNDMDEIHKYLDNVIDYLQNRKNIDNSRIEIVRIDRKPKKYFTYKKILDKDFTSISIPDSMVGNLPPFILETINTVNDVTNIDNLAAPIMTNARVAIMRNDQGKNLVSNVIDVF